MSVIATPNHQTRVLDPYQQVVYRYDSVDSRVFLSRETNKLLRTISDGKDIVLKGFEIKDITRDENGFTLTVTGGRAILDDTFIEVDEDTTITVDYATEGVQYDAGGSFLIFLSYRYLQTLTNNPFMIKAVYKDSSNNVKIADYIENRDRIIIAEIPTDPNVEVITRVGKQIQCNNIDSSKLFVGGINPDDLPNVVSMLGKVTSMGIIGSSADTSGDNVTDMSSVYRGDLEYATLLESSNYKRLYYDLLTSPSLTVKQGHADWSTTGFYYQITENNTVLQTADTINLGANYSKIYLYIDAENIPADSLTVEYSPDDGTTWIPITPFEDTYTPGVQNILLRFTFADASTTPTLYSFGVLYDAH